MSLSRIWSRAIDVVVVSTYAVVGAWLIWLAYTWIVDAGVAGVTGVITTLAAAAAVVFLAYYFRDVLLWLVAAALLICLILLVYGVFPFALYAWFGPTGIVIGLLLLLLFKSKT